MDFANELRFARSAARQAGELALAYREKGVIPEDKADSSPVTIADQECEKLLCSLIEEQFPGDGILGEEGAAKQGTSGRRWIIDPIDGTRDFVRGNRLFCNLVALEAGGESVVGVANFPALGEMYSACRGGGAFRDDAQIRVSSIADIAKAVACVNGLNKLTTDPFGARIPGFMRNFWAIRSMGGALDAMFVAAGHAEVWLERTAMPWDLAALRVIALEAGARFFDYTGEDTIHGGNAVICTPKLEATVREFLGI